MVTCKDGKNGSHLALGEILETDCSLPCHHIQPHVAQSLKSAVFQTGSRLQSCLCSRYKSGSAPIWPGQLMQIQGGLHAPLQDFVHKLLYCIRWPSTMGVVKQTFHSCGFRYRLKIKEKSGKKGARRQNISYGLIVINKNAMSFR